MTFLRFAYLSPSRVQCLCCVFVKGKKQLCTSNLFCCDCGVVVVVCYVLLCLCFVLFCFGVVVVIGAVVVPFDRV